MFFGMASGGIVAIYLGKEAFVRRLLSIAS